jgi:hypothetical protein
MRIEVMMGKQNNHVMQQAKKYTGTVSRFAGVALNPDKHSEDMFQRRTSMITELNNCQTGGHQFQAATNLIDDGRQEKGERV